MFVMPPVHDVPYVHPVAQIACPAGQAAHVDVAWDTNPIRYDLSKSSNELNGYHIDTKNPYGSNVQTDAGGIAHGEFLIKSSVSTKMQTYPTLNLTCLWVDTVKVDIIIDQNIYIASENKPGSCKYDAIMEHEMKHVKTDQRVVQDFAPAMKQAVSAAVRKVGMVGPKNSNDIPAVQAKINDYIQQSLSAVKEQMQAERKARQQAVDSLGEYQAVDRKCK